jgi:hypothetical protein
MQLPQLLRTSVILAACAIAACGGTDAIEAPLGPNGGKNTLSVERDGVLENLESIHLGLTPKADDKLLLSLSGSVDPIENAADDEYSIVLEVELTKSELVALAQPATIVVDGTSRFIPPMNTEYMRSPSASPAIQGAAAKMVCFCNFDQSGTQKVTGELTVKKATDTQLFGSIQVTIDGFLPGRGQNSVIDIQSDFDLDLHKTASSGLLAR